MVKRIETELLTGFIHNAVADLPSCAKEIHDGNYTSFPSVLTESICKASQLQEVISENIQKESNIQDLWLYAGIKSLLRFIQYNWTGPRIDSDDTDFLSDRVEEALKSLSLNDECNQNVKRPELLYFSKIIFSNECLQTIYKSCMWWLFRTNLLHQVILEENSGTLFDESERLIEEITKLDLLEDPYCNTLFNLEVTQFYLYYRRIQHSEKHLKIAQDAGMLKLDLRGIMGRRTRYQQEDKAQLFLSIILEKDPFPSKVCANLPKSLDLNDDLRLEHIKYSEALEKAQLGTLEEAIILAKFMHLQLSQPRDKLTDEELMPYLTNVIEHTQNWSLKVSSLFCRSLLEANHKRTVERSMMQVEHLLHEMNNHAVSVMDRTHLFFASGLKPIWVFEQTFANFMLNLGMVKGALELYIKLGLWEEVIVCYSILELKHKAAEVIRQEIDKKPTVKLWCLLGDATQEVEHYETAWKLSNEKSSRAQRHWGFYYYAKKDYKTAIPHLKLSVELNNIQENVWLRLGYAALQTEDWKLAATAYKRYCALESTTFEAWNNLAKAYIKLGEKPKAWKALQDAIKCNFDRWEIWDNLMVVSIDLGHFAEVIRCYQRILDLKRQHIDVQILQILTNAIVKDINDIEGNSTRRLLEKTAELFGRITSFERSNPNIWRMYAELTALRKTDLDYQKAAQYLQHAHRAAVADPRWFQAESTTLYVLDLCLNLIEAYLRCTSDSPDHKKRGVLESAKLSLQGVIKKVKEQEWKEPKIIDSLQKVEDSFQTIVSEIEILKDAMSVSFKSNPTLKFFL